MTRNVLQINIICHATIRFSLKHCLQLHCEVRYCRFLIRNLQCDIPQTNYHAELFFITKRLDKSDPKATITQYIRRSYERKASAQRQFVESAVKQTEIKNSRLCTKIKKTLNQSSIIRKESDGINGDNESSWEDLDLNDFEESWQERELVINMRRKTSYLRPPSKKNKI